MSVRCYLFYFLFSERTRLIAGTIDDDIFETKVHPGHGDVDVCSV